ncbi:MAG: hypothetical protein OEZ16_01660 [Chromatiales bacterium]|nr:hypothetical protein [Chromatiales bacterium]
MKLYSYVITHDYGFAPNPFGGFLTLATCMPQIRRSAQIGDWLMGTGSTDGVGVDRLIFLAKITGKPSLADYSILDKYRIKIPNSCEEKWAKRGDNIYFQNADGEWNQRSNPFHGEEEMAHDLSGLNVLVCDEFWYFGASAPIIPVEHRHLIKKGPNCKANENKDVTSFLHWVSTRKRGINGNPSSINA